MAMEMLFSGEERSMSEQGRRGGRVRGDETLQASPWK